MKFMAFSDGDASGLAVANGDSAFRGRRMDQHEARLLAALSGGLEGLRSLAETLLTGDVIDPEMVTLLPPLQSPRKILCIGLNYVDHVAEGGLARPPCPTMFGRFASSLIGHGMAMVRPNASDQLDYEGELAAIIGPGGRNIPEDAALDHIAGYSVFNDGSVRDYQTRTPQWTMGKNFDATGSFGPFLVSSDALPPGADGLKLETRLNGETVQSVSTSDLIFDVRTLVSFISQAMTLEPGDVIVTGTPAGVGAVRTPPLWMKPGDVCEVEIEGIGLLRNPIVQEGA